MRLPNYLILIVFLFFLSCKKEEKKEESIAEPVPSACVCEKENIGSDPGNQVLCYGFLSILTHSDLISGQAPRNYSEVMAYFTNSPSTSENGDFVTVDSIFLDDLPIQLLKDANNDPAYYWRISNGKDKQEWIVFGNHNIPSFSFIADVENPIADFSAVPDQISKGLPQSFILKNVSNITSANAIIVDESGKSNFNVSLKIKTGSNTVCFPQEQLNLLGPGKATILINLENTKIQKFDSKNFSFTKKFNYTKSITINP